MLLALSARPATGALAPDLLAKAWLIAALLSVAIGLLQYFGLSHSLGQWASQTRPGEAFGNLRQRNQFASLMGIGLGALIWVVAKRRVTAFHLFLLALLAVGNAASNSRTGAVQWIAIVLITALWSTTGRRAALGMALYAFAAYVLAVFALPWLLVTLTDFGGRGLLQRLSETPGCESRVVLWSNVLTLIAQRPWSGWGWGELDYAHYMTLYPGERFCDILDNAHNLPLHLAVELGIPFSLMVCGVSAWLILRARPWRETVAARQMAWGVLALILIHSMLEYPLWYGPFQMAAGLCVYLLWVTPIQPVQAETPTPDPRPILVGARYFQVALAAVLLTAVTYAAWDYRRVSQIYLAPAQRAPAYREDTLEKAADTRLFRRQFDFAALSLTPLTGENAAQIHAVSNRLLHFSPEPRVIEKVIESAVMLGRDDEALLHLARYRAAFPKEHDRWRRSVVLPEQATR